MLTFLEVGSGGNLAQGSGYMPEELCQVSPKSHYVSQALHSDPSPLDCRPFFCRWASLWNRLQKRLHVHVVCNIRAFSEYNLNEYCIVFYLELSNGTLSPQIEVGF